MGADYQMVSAIVDRACGFYLRVTDIHIGAYSHVRGNWPIEMVLCAAASMGSGHARSSRLSLSGENANHILRPILRLQDDHAGSPFHVLSQLFPACLSGRDLRARKNRGLEFRGAGDL